MDMFCCSRVELMVAVLTQMTLLTYKMVPFLMVGLAFLAIMVLVTVFVVYHTKQLVSSWATPFLTIIRETRYILFPAMLILT
jgi:hypothetical protein